MSFETLLQNLHEQREVISQHLDATSRQQLIQYLESYTSSGEVSDEFFIFCGKKFPKLTDSERLSSKDKGKLTPTDAQKFANELIRAIRQPTLKNNEKNKK